ncbi:uncharacterized protein si:ch211-217g15.3 [Ctenopharyngodon idella]|uniref:uncharacterized protein si:ch211-217g15.3 n=1 Tax=Ctenopharyngodon idella TaxID=7959 RepID=UPI00222E6BC3|nr:uncharacterized protein si:ch211-217g15.3 [Ctenopharyngodon idella]
MMRFSVLICLSVLLFSTSAKPYRPKEKVFSKAVQDTVFDHPNGKIILGMKEVEPPQDMDITDFDIDPNMLIWKAVKEEIQQKYNRPEEDKDALYHPFDIKHPADPKQHENYFQPLRHDQVQKYDKPEEDRDGLYHGMFGVAVEPMRGEKDVIGGNARPIYSSPEEDKDDLYHADLKGHQSDQQAMNIFPVHPKRVHTEPEVDLDELYHKQ